MEDLYTKARRNFARVSIFYLLVHAHDYTPNDPGIGYSIQETFRFLFNLPMV